MKRETHATFTSASHMNVASISVASIWMSRRDKCRASYINVASHNECRVYMKRETHTTFSSTSHMNVASIWMSHLTYKRRVSQWMSRPYEEKGTRNIHTGWRRCIGCLKMQVSFRKRANNHRALLLKMTYKDKASYDATPPCIRLTYECHVYMNVASIWTSRLSEYHVYMHVASRKRMSRLVMNVVSHSYMNVTSIWTSRLYECHVCLNVASRKRMSRLIMNVASHSYMNVASHISVYETRLTTRLASHVNTHLCAVTCWCETWHSCVCRVSFIYECCVSYIDIWDASHNASRISRDTHLCDATSWCETWHAWVCCVSFIYACRVPYISIWDVCHNASRVSRYTHLCDANKSRSEHICSCKCAAHSSTSCIFRRYCLHSIALHIYYT